MRDIRVTFVGDSIVAGVGDPAGHGWVGRVVADLDPLVLHGDFEPASRLVHS